MTDLGAIVEATIGCADIDATERLLCNAFDWISDTDEYGRIVGVEGQSRPLVRLIPLRPKSISEIAPEPWEPGLRMLSVYSRNPEETVARIEMMGGDPGPVYTWEAFPGVVYSDCLARVADNLFLVFPCSARPLPSPALASDPSRIHGELHNIALTVSDFQAAIHFFHDVGGMEILLEKVVAPGPRDQPELKKMLGLPPESTYYVALLGAADRYPARLEINAYEGVPAVVPVERSFGLKRITFAVPSPPRTAAALVAGGALPVAESSALSVVTWSDTEIGLLRAD